MPSHGDSALNPERPTGDATPPAAGSGVEKRRSALAWLLLVIPPLAVGAAVGLGLLIDTLTLGPPGFFFVLILIGPGALALGLACAGPVIAFLSRESLRTKVMLWVGEIAACLFVYVWSFPRTHGWS